MTIIEAIERTDNLKPNGYTQEEKVKWLSDLDGQIKTEIIDTHEGFEGVSFEGYTDETDVNNTVLLVPSPYDDVYIKWLMAQIDFANGESGKYNNSVTMFNTAMTAYGNYYNRTHMPLNINSRYW